MGVQKAFDVHVCTRGVLMQFLHKVYWLYDSTMLNLGEKCACIYIHKVRTIATIVTHKEVFTVDADIFKASQPWERASGSRAYERHEMQGVTFKYTRHECSVFVNLRPHQLHIRSRHQFSSLEKTGSHCRIRTHVHPFTRQNA